MSWILGVVVSTSSSAGGGHDYERALLGLISGLCPSLVPRVKVFCSSKDGSHATLLADSSHGPLTFESESVSLRLPAKGIIPSFRSSARSANLPKLFSKEKVSLAYFASPTRAAMSVAGIPLISTIWDLGHRDLPEFPEFGGASWAAREELYANTLARSFHVFTDSPATGGRIEKHYGVRSDRWSPLGLTFPLEANDGFIPTHEVPGGAYFFYPAKRWAHKNHLVLIDAMEIVLKELPDARLVFTGHPNGGGGGLVSRRINELGLGKSVVDYGFVDAAMVDLLMRNATALVMPSFLGPTNIPPLHALAVGTPAIVSDFHVFDPVIQSRLVTVPPDQPALWANEMLRTVHQKRQKSLLPDSAKQEEILGAVFAKFLERSRRWG